MKNRNGFSLLETILYLALIVIMLAALLPIALQIVDIGAKSSVDQEVYSVARYGSERMKYEIRNASDVNIASSSFGVNFAASSGAALFLTESSGTLNPTKFSVASGTLQITQGTGTAIALIPTSTRVSSLIFLNNSTGTFKNINFVLTIVPSSTSARQEFLATSTITLSAEVRSK